MYFDCSHKKAIQFKTTISKNWLDTHKKIYYRIESKISQALKIQEKSFFQPWYWVNEIRTKSNLIGIILISAIFIYAIPSKRINLERNIEVT